VELKSQRPVTFTFTFAEAFTATATGGYFMK